jgi:hypothetical protein
MEWAAYHDLEPWGAPAEDHRWQTLCDLTVRMNAAKPIDKTILFFDRDPEETARLEALSLAHVNRASILDAKIEAYFEQRIANGR